MKKVLFVATVSSHIKAFHIPYLKHFQELGWETHVACNAATGYEASEEAVETTVKIPHCDHFHNIPFQRSPLKSQNWNAYKQLKKVIDENHFDIIHCHTPVGGAIGRLAARAARKRGTRVFYTAHGFHFYKGAPLKNWLMFYPVEKICSRWTDTLITINKEDHQLAQNKFKAKEIIYVPGVGIDFDKFQKKDFANILKNEFTLSDADTILLSVGELNTNKNHEIVIRALAEIDKPSVHYVIVGQGELHEKLLQLAKELNVDEQVHLLGYRTDIARLYKMADIFIHPSFREGLPVAVMEAMASGLPVIASNVRGNRDLISDKGGELCNPHDVSSFVRAIHYRIANENQRCIEGEFNQKFIQQFSVEQVLEDVNRYYFC